MGQQQLLFIIIGVIVVALAVAVAMTMFVDSSISSNRDAITNDLLALSSRARDYYRRPAALGGGDGAFDNSKGGIGLSSITQLTSKPSNANGRVEITAVAANEITMRGVGMELVNSTDSVEVTMTVKPDSVIIHVVR